MPRIAKENFFILLWTWQSLKGLQDEQSFQVLRSIRSHRRLQTLIATAIHGSMSTVGEQLRSAREARNLTIEQVAEMTKMRADHVRAVEEGNYGVFPAPVYIRGFIRTYCSLLKIDRTPVLKDLESEIGVETRFAEVPIGSRHPQGVLDLATLQLSKIGWRKGGLIVGLVLLVVCVVTVTYAWKQSKSSDPLKNLEPGVYRASNTVETLPLPQTQPR